MLCIQWHCLARKLGFTKPLCQERIDSYVAGKPASPAAWYPGQLLRTACCVRTMCKVAHPCDACSHLLSMPVLGLQKHPASAESALQLIVADYQSALPRTRSGAALAVKACAGHFEGEMLMTALHFLLEHGLADMAHVPDQKATVSEQMMQAGKDTATLLVTSMSM